MILLNAKESRGVDRLSQDKYGIASYSLMTRAGEAVADALVRRWPNALGGDVLVVAGKGNNGGDGFVAARWLLERGSRVRAVMLADAASLKGDAARAHAKFAARGGSVIEVTAEGGIDSAIGAQRPAAVIDAIFGTGLNAEIKGLPRRAIELVNALGVPVAAVDIASGVNADTGAVMGAAVRAALTVTFGFAKYGHVSYPGADSCGELVIAEIGFAPHAIEEISPRGLFLERGDVGRLIPRRAQNTHKGTYGHPLVIAGARGKSGAAVLTSRGALRIGAGLVTAAIPESVAGVVAAGQTELMTEPMPDRGGHFDARATIERLAPLIDGKSALVTGPGIGVSDDTRDLVAWLVNEGAQPTRPLLIDADGLNVLALLGPAILKRARGPVVLTPHPGEMARLLGVSNAAVNTDRITGARRLAETTGAYVLLKGARTVVVTPDEAVFVNSSGNPGMATPGMGDVLSGIIGGLLGQSMAPTDALKLGVFVHGFAADLLAERIGPVGYLAGDLANELPTALKALRSGEVGGRN
jgi:ADP-dependent NAD(P)H-hydrate dehydratase / NAD(P)H-hydrate epimerase